MSLKSKVEDKEYINSLSHRKRRELRICSLILSDEEMESQGSVVAGYRLARTKLIDEIIPEVDPQLYHKIKGNKKVPIFDVENLIADWKRIRK